MIAPAILDSSGLISFISSTDSNHKRAILVKQLIQKTKAPIILPGEIFAETINAIGKKISHQTAIKTAAAILESNEFIIDNTTPEIRSNALEIFKNQPSSVSFTDCLVMAFADHYHTKQIFGFDEIFKKNKYQRLGLD